MKQLVFYLQYAARNLWRNRRWSAFAIFSVAAGVMAVVALRSLGLAIGDALTDNVRGGNKGDLLVQIASGGGPFGSSADPSNNDYVFNQVQIDDVNAWVRENDASVTFYNMNSSLQVTALDAQTAGRPQFVTTYLIDPTTYPVTQDIFALDPAGVPLGELFQGGNEIVISKNFADGQNVRVGDLMRVSGTETQFVVRGIIPTEAQAGLAQFASDEIFSTLFGFVYLDLDIATTELSINTAPNRMNINLPDGTTDEQIVRASEQVSRIVRQNMQNYSYVTNVVDLLETYQQIADILGRFIVTLGLGAMLLGGIGIINTMLVMVRRRTEEIAAMKTFGLKGRQIGSIFMAEAFWLGLFGSIVGGILGVLLSGVANSYGSAFIQQPLRWRFYPEAVLFGLVLGLIVSMIFGVMPVITASRVRPAIILRPNENHIPVAGAIYSLIALMFVVISLGVIAGQIIGNTIAGVLLVAVTLFILWLLTLLLWVVVWLVGKLPAFGVVDFKLALRNLSTRRMRTATTLLAISTGMFALSSIAFFGAGVRDILNFTLTQSLGGNVLIFPVLPPSVANPLIDARLNTLEGVEYRTRVTFYSGTVKAINGVDIGETMSAEDEARIRREIREASQSGDFERMGELIEQLPENFNVGMSSKITNNPEVDTNGLLEGRKLTLEDEGKLVAVIRKTDKFSRYDLQLGSTVTVEIQSFTGGRSQTLTFEVVGIMEDVSAQSFQSATFEGEFQVPPGAVRGSGAPMELTLAQVKPENLNDALLALTSIPLVFALDLSFFDSVITRMIQMFSALPILVGLLSLAAAAVIMANTVALATLERRRQIGILKAIGLKSNRVLGVMLIENIMVSLLGAILGIGLSALGVYLMSKFSLDLTILIPKDALPVAIALVVAAVVIGATATFLSASVATRERVLNVLRYE